MNLRMSAGENDTGQLVGRRNILSLHDWPSLPLGDIPDVELSFALGCTALVVAKAHRRLGRPSANRPHEAAASADIHRGCFTQIPNRPQRTFSGMKA